jgi:hypothetical protein
MSYNVSYSSLPTLTSNSIGYTVTQSGTTDLINISSGVIFDVCSFSLTPGVYAITCNISNFRSTSDNANAIAGISTVSGGMTQRLSSPAFSVDYDNSLVYVSCINFVYYYSNTGTNTLYITARMDGTPYSYNPANPENYPSFIYYCQAVRIA